MYLNDSQKKLACTYISSSFRLSSGVQPWQIVFHRSLGLSFSTSLAFLHDFSKQESFTSWQIPLSCPPKDFAFPSSFLFYYLIQHPNSDVDGSGVCMHQGGDAAASLCGRFYTNGENESQKIQPCFHMMGRCIFKMTKTPF